MRFTYVSQLQESINRTATDEIYLVLASGLRIPCDALPLHLGRIIHRHDGKEGYDNHPLQAAHSPRCRLTLESS